MRRFTSLTVVLMAAAGLSACQPAAEEDQTETPAAVAPDGPLDDAIAAEDLPPDDAIPAEEEVPEDVAPLTEQPQTLPPA